MRIKEIKDFRGYSLKYGKNILKLIKLDKKFYEFEKFQLVNSKDKNIYDLFGEKFYSFVKKNKIIIVTENSERDRNQNKFMKTSGLKIKYAKQLFSRNLRDFRSNYKDIFEYRSPGELGLLKFFRIYKNSVEDPIIKYEQFQIFFKKMKKLARNVYDINNWKVVSLNKVNIGVVMPHVFPENPEQGTLWDIGLKPRYRGKGHGRIMHAGGLELLKQMGVKKYAGSTRTTNHAMLRVFELNGCKKWFLRYFFYAE